MDEPLISTIEEIISRYNQIPEKKKYWLIRTLAGTYYESFKRNGYVAIGHNEVENSDITKIIDESQNSPKFIMKALKSLCSDVYGKDSRPGLTASQIFKFVFEVKVGDVVIIPSENSDKISIGTVVDSRLLKVTDEIIEGTGCPFFKRKRIKWEQTISRDRLDPFLYRLFQSHQAINDISPYWEIIERTMGNFFIKENEGNLVLDIATDAPINAKDLFQLGYFLLNYSQDFFEKYNLPFNVNDVDVKINLNSKGKIQFKALNAGTIWVMALLTIAVVGGGLKFKNDSFEFDLSTKGLIKNITDYQNNSHDRAMMDEVMKSVESLKVQSPDDALKVLKQFSPNKDLPK